MLKLIDFLLIVTHYLIGFWTVRLLQLLYEIAKERIKKCFGRIGEGMSSIDRVKAWAHWARLENPKDEDKLLMALDLEKLLNVVEAANALKGYQYLGVNEELNFKLLRLRNSIAALEELEKG